MTSVLVSLSSLSVIENLIQKHTQISMMTFISKRYATALIKRQWGANLSKFNGVQMLGGVTMNGETIYSQAQEEMEKLEEQIQLAYELPPEYMMG